MTQLINQIITQGGVEANEYNRVFVSWILDGSEGGLDINPQDTVLLIRILKGLVATIEGMPQEVKGSTSPTLASLEAKVRVLTKERDEYRTQFEKATWDNDALRKAGEGVSSKEHNTLRQEANNSAVKCERLEHEVKRLTDCLRDIQGAREEEARRLQEISEMQRTANANYQREHKRALALDHLVKALVGVLYAGEVER